MDTINDEQIASIEAILNAPLETDEDYAAIGELTDGEME